MTVAVLIIFIFFGIVVATISFEAVFRNESKKNFNNGIKDIDTKYEELKKSVQTFDFQKLEEPKKN